MKQSDLLFVILYGGAFLLIFYLIVKLFYKPVYTPVYTPTVYRETVMWPWSYSNYNYWPKWNGLYEPRRMTVPNRGLRSGVHDRSGKR